MISLILVILFFMLVFGLAVAIFVFWVMMLINALTRKFKGENEKLLWVLVIIFANWIGAIIYYFLVYRKNIKMKR